MRPSIIDKYIKRPNYLFKDSITKFVANLKKGKKIHIIRYVHYNEHQDLENYYGEQLSLFMLVFDNEHIFKGDHSTWNVTYNMHDIQINVIRKIIYNLYNNNAYTIER